MEIQILIEKFKFFEGFDQNILRLQNLQESDFSMKMWFSIPLENLLQVVQPRSRYLTCSTNIDLSNEEKNKGHTSCKLEDIGAKVEKSDYFRFSEK